MKNDKDKVLKAQGNRNVGKKSTKSGVPSNSQGGGNNGYFKCKSNVAILEKKVRNKKRKMSVFNNVANMVQMMNIRMA